jgi:hypothetical protein
LISFRAKSGDVILVDEPAYVPGGHIPDRFGIDSTQTKGSPPCG